MDIIFLHISGYLIRIYYPAIITTKLLYKYLYETGCKNEIRVYLNVCLEKRFSRYSQFDERIFSGKSSSYSIDTSYASEYWNAI